MENKKNKKHPSEQSQKVQKSIIDRLSRVEGQIRGIKAMIENGTYCDDIINQIEASRSALNAIELVLLEGHIKNCVADELKNGDSSAVDELIKTIKKLTK